MTIIRRDPPNERERVVRVSPRYTGLLTPQPEAPSGPALDPVGVQVIVKDGGMYGPRGPQGTDGLDGTDGAPGIDGLGVRLLERTFASPSQTWLWEHGLNTLAIEVNTYENDGITEKDCVSELLDSNTVRIEWYYPESGVVRLLF